MAVVDDFVAHIDRGSVALEGDLDDFDRTIDAGTKTSGIGEQDAHEGETSSLGVLCPGVGRSSAQRSAWLQSTTPRRVCVESLPTRVPTPTQRTDMNASVDRGGPR